MLSPSQLLFFKLTPSHFAEAHLKKNQKETNINNSSNNIIPYDIEHNHFFINKINSSTFPISICNLYKSTAIVYCFFIQIEIKIETKHVIFFFLCLDRRLLDLFEPIQSELQPPDEALQQGRNPDRGLLHSPSTDYLVLCRKSSHTQLRPSKATVNWTG